MAQARTKQGHEAERLLRLALEKAAAVDRIDPGAWAYNAACVSALLGEDDDCRKWLDRARQTDKLPAPDFMLSDSDLESVRDRDWFRAYLLPDEP